jgi:hypothetical protein
MQNKKLIKHLNYGIFISQDILHEAKLDENEIELEISKQEIKILPGINLQQKEFTMESPLWRSLGIGEVNFNVQDHDAELYE